MPRNFDPADRAFTFGGSKPHFAYADKPQPLLMARKIDRNASKDGTDVTYCVIDAAPESQAKERRVPPRKRTRLRCGKILNLKGKFLIECQVHDRTVYGARLRLMSAIALPPRINFYDDEQHALLEAEIVWQQNADIGVYFRTRLNAETIRAGQRSTVAGKYYAVS